jgi:hypothetical protein
VGEDDLAAGSGSDTAAEDRGMRAPITFNCQRAQIEETRLLLRFAANDLSEIERLAADGFARDVPQRELARAEIGFGRGSIFHAQHRAFRKMRGRLRSIGITSVGDLL